MFKTRRFKKDIITSNQDGWQPDIIRRLVDNAKQDSLDKNIFYKGYAFTVHGFTQKLYEDFEVQRKVYSNLQMKSPDANVFVVVEFVIKSGEDFYNMTKCEEPKNPDMLRYRKNFGWFCFNGIYKGKALIPALDFKIILLPKEWEDVKECLWIAKWQNSCPTIEVRVEYPGNPDPETVVEESLQRPFRVRRFGIESLFAFDSKALSTNLVFRWDINWD